MPFSLISRDRRTSFRLSFRLLLVLIVAAGLFTLPALAQQTYYVSPQGNDGNNGSQAQPWKTVIYAVKQVNPGDQVLVADGTYPGGVIITRSGTSNAYITLKSINRHGARIQVLNGAGRVDGIKVAANYVTVDGFEIFDAAPGNGHEGNGITVYNNHHVNILNNKIHDFGGSGIQAGLFDHVTIENNIVYNNSKYAPNQTSGISMYQARAVDNAAGYHVIVRNNRSYGNVNKVPNSAGRTTDGNGILVDDFWNSTGQATNVIFPHRTLIENNLCYDNGGKGIQVFKSSYVDVFNNTAYHNNYDLTNTGTWRAELSNAFASETVWRNNIGVAKPGNGILQWNRGILIGRGGDTVWENNITHSGTAGDNSILLDGAAVTEQYLVSNNLLGVNPQFKNASGLDFSLTANSPAINAGSDQIRSFFDINYQTRPAKAVDIGAFEYDDPNQSVDIATPEHTEWEAYELAQSYPNPFRSQTQIYYTLPVGDHVTIDVFDMLGRHIETLVDGVQSAGVHSVHFIARSLPAGAYLYTFTSGAHSETKMMVLLP